MSDIPRALVTGASRGIGKATARQLAERGFHVLMASRVEADGRAAADELARDGLSVEAVACDVTNADDIAAMARRVSQGGQLDLLINNAGLSLDGFNVEVATGTLAVNVLGALAVSEALLPHVSDGGAIVFVSSGMADLSAFSKPLAARFSAPDLDRAGLVQLLDEFVAVVASGRVQGSGWPSNAYRVSKAGMNALAHMFARDLRPRGISVNAVCPGWVRTRMGGDSAPRDVSQGAASIVATALDPPRPGGGFFRDGRAIDW